MVDIPEGATVASAALHLAVLDGSEQGGSISLVDGPWTEGETTWASAPPIGAQIAPLVAPINGTVVEVDVTGAVTGNGRADFYITTESEDGIDVASRENPQAPPALVITLAGGEEGPTGEEADLVGAGDIAGCDSDGDEATAALLDEVVARGSETVVFTAGDNAYEAGSAANFADCFDPSWGRHKAITRPAVGRGNTGRPGPPPTSSTSALLPATRQKAGTATTWVAGTSWSSTPIAPRLGVRPGRHRSNGCGRTLRPTPPPALWVTGINRCSAPAPGEPIPRCSPSSRPSTTPMPMS